MFLSLLYCIILAITGFLCALPVFLYICKDISAEYKIKKDVWVYMWFLSLFFVSALYCVLPDFKDMIYNLKYKNIIAVFTLAALIYVAFLLEIKKLLYIVMVVSSAIVVLLIPEHTLLFENVIPVWAERLVIFISLFLITFFAGILNAMPAIFSIFVLTVLSGVAILSILGGVPLFMGLTASVLCGIWLGYLRFNWDSREVSLNSGACASAGFLLAGFLLLGSMELSGPSMLILISYLSAETLWAVIRRYIWRIKEPELYYNTVYFVCYTKDISADAIMFSITKIGIVNVIFSCFQLYAPNSFSIPFCSLIINLWLLNMLYHASDNSLTFAQANENFLGELKEGFNLVKKSLKRRKK